MPGKRGLQAAAVMAVRGARATRTQQELAHDLGVSVASVSRWERGITRPNRNESRRILATLKPAADPTAQVAAS